MEPRAVAFSDGGYVIDVDIEARITEVRERLELIIAANDRRYDERNEQNLTSRMAAYNAINTRLDGMNEFRAALSDQIARGVSRSEHDVLRDTTREAIEQAKTQTTQQLRGEIGPLRARIDEIGRPNWTLLVSSISVIAMIVAGMWLVIGLRIDASVSPVLLTTTANQMTLSSHSKAIGEVQATDARMIADAGAHTADVKAKLAEIETQFCAADTIRNINLAQEMRILAMLWGKAFPSTPYPTDNAFYPRVCNRGN